MIAKTIWILGLVGAFVVGISLGSGVDAGLSPDNDCDGCIDKNDIKKNAVRAKHIKKDSVGGSEVKTTSKLIFGSCEVDPPALQPGILTELSCADSRISTEDNAIAQFEITRGAGFPCIGIISNDPLNGFLQLLFTNHCSTVQDPGAFTVSYIVFKAT